MIDCIEDCASRAHVSLIRLASIPGPYIEHPKAIAAIVRTVWHTPEMIAAAFLHDVVGDTPVTLGETRARFSDVMARLGDDLTEARRLDDGNRATREASARAHSAHACPEARTIKLADLIDNATSIARHDPDFSVHYTRETRALLEVVTQGDPDLSAWACSPVHAWKAARP